MGKVSTTQKRLAEMMREFDITAADIVRKTGINKSTLSNYINGKRVADQEHLSIIADPYGIDPAWLMGYDVPMRPVPQIDFDVLSPEDAEIMRRISSLPPDKKSALLNMLADMIKLLG